MANKHNKMEALSDIQALIGRLPDVLQDSLQSLNDACLEKPDVFHTLLQQSDIKESLVKVCACSQFVREKILHQPGLLHELIETGDLVSSVRRVTYMRTLNELKIEEDTQLMQALRLFRRREMVRIAWRDLAGWADLDETLRDVTELAEVCIQFTLDYFFQQACQRKGVPVDSEGQPINLVILGMGKLGAWELNYSSDIDLIFAFKEEGELNDAKHTSHGEFFTKICQKLVKALDEITVDGFVFRTDTRLRPFGDSGPLVMNFDGLENYYMTQAREWERYAMIKARQVAGDYHNGELLMAMIKPFVYRRYLDYGAFEELRKIKVMITQELLRKDRLDNVKLGPGGIREIEFIGQAFQLIRGGCEKSLQRREIVAVLELLKKNRLMEGNDVDNLKTGYQYLRRVENHIQQYKDEQTHDLPNCAEARASLAYSMGFEEWEAFYAQLNQVRSEVHTVFEKVFSLTDEEQKSIGAQQLWLDSVNQDQALKILAFYKYLGAEKTLSRITGLRDSVAVKKLTPKGAAVLDRLMPKVIETMAATEHKDNTLYQLLDLFEKIAGRSVYLSLLEENPGALNQLVTLTQASPWICKYFASDPVLLDELLDAHSLYEPLGRDGLVELLQHEMSAIDQQDEEQLMHKLRQFKHQNVLRVAAADIMGVIPVMVVSDYLTLTAEVILQQVVDSAWQMLTAKHGNPPDTSRHAKGFAILGLGKLGGIELGYGSDLDMVFLYQCADTQAMTDGTKSVSCSQFYLRLGQKIRHFLDTRMLSGVLYEVDLRLRPSGDSGLLVTNMNAYEPYLQNDAWTWEHQALLRARFVAGDEGMRQEFEQIRRRVLSIRRDKEALKKEVRDMREKMRDNLAPKDPEIFHLKQSHGGIADIEFIVQFLVLAHAVENPDLTHYTDNVRILNQLASDGRFGVEQAENLKNAFCQYRDFGHHRVLQELSAQADISAFVEEREQVKQIWRELME